MDAAEAFSRVGWLGQNREAWVGSVPAPVKPPIFVWVVDLGDSK